MLGKESHGLMGVYGVESLEHYNHCEEISLSLSLYQSSTHDKAYRKTRLKWTKMISWICKDSEERTIGAGKTQ
jgi:hypothetical protein